MKVTQIKIAFQETCSSGMHGVRETICPSVELTADLEYNDDTQYCLDTLMERAKRQVQDQIDWYLMENSKRPKYHTGPFFDTVVSEELKRVAILPANWPTPDGYKDAQRLAYRILPGIPIELAMKLATEYCNHYAEYTLFDCSSGDLSVLTPKDEYTQEG